MNTNMIHAEMCAYAFHDATIVRWDVQLVKDEWIEAWEESWEVTLSTTTFDDLEDAEAFAEGARDDVKGIRATVSRMR